MKRVSYFIVLALVMSVFAGAAQLTTNYDTPVALGDEISQENVTGVLLTEVPEESQAVVSVNGKTLRSGDAVSSSELEEMTLIPQAKGDYTAEVSYIPLYGDSIGSDETISVGIFSRKNQAPTAEDVLVTTYKGIAIDGSFQAVDPDGDEMSFQITGTPKIGTVELNEEGGFTYTPGKNKVGKDSFTYTATDAQGNVSNQATVTITVEKPHSKLTYADMEGSSACYAALRLNEEGVFTGCKIGDNYYFQPETLVTRGDFLTMALELSGMEADSLEAETVFADDETTPDWLKPYVTTALKCGIISGDKSGDALVFRAEEQLTRAEAAVILDNILELSEVSPSFSENVSVPVWAMQAAANLDGAGIICVDESGSYDMNEAVTRAEAAKMLSAMMDELGQEKKSNAGLLSWVFE